MRFVFAAVIVICCIALLVFYEETAESDVPVGAKKETYGAEVYVRGTYEGPIALPIPESDIVSGGPGKDGIPSIDEPVFKGVGTDVFLEDSDLGIVLTNGTEHKFYPFDVLVWHEIVNDWLGDVPVAVTYCPLCATGVVYQRTVGGAAVEFGVSGSLWQSNLLMYNRTDDPANESLWSQVLGTAVTGVHAGTQLSIVQSNVMTFNDFKEKYSDGQVLTRDTGFARAYGVDPYEGYEKSAQVGFPATFSDELFSKTYVLGIRVEGVARAYPFDALRIGETHDEIGAVPVVVTKNSVGEVSIARSDTGGVVPFVGAFWFSWSSAHPQSTVWYDQ